MMRSPDSRAGREAALRNEVKQYRRTLQKISKMKTKILCALRDEGCPEAGQMLQTPPPEARGPRCQNCGGCQTLSGMGPCMTCLDCRNEADCTEHTRLCFGWRQPPTTFVMGSTVTGVSSLCNAAEYELDKYKELVEKLGEASLEVDAVLDQFPAGAEEHSNGRFNQARRERDIRCEDEQLMIIESLLGRYQEQRVRLIDVRSDSEDGVVDDAVEVSAGAPGGYGLISRTETHYTFGGQVQPEGFEFAPGPAEERQPVGDDLGLGLGAGDFSILDGDLLAGLRERSPAVPQPQGPPTEPGEEAVSPPTGARPKATVSLAGPVSREEDTTTKSSTSGATSVAQGAFAGGLGGPGSDETRRQDRTPPSSKDVTTMSTSTVTTSSASVHVSAVEAGSSRLPPPVPPVAPVLPATPVRRRSTSEGETEGPRHTGTKDKLFQIKMLVAGRSKTWAQDVAALTLRIKSSTGSSMRWAEEEVRNLQRQLDDLEQLESSAWKWVAESEGADVRRDRISRWLVWHGRQVEHIRNAKKLMWDAERLEGGRSGRGRDDWPRSRGHVEKVKLPTFTGRQEDFSEFRNQFRELCRGEQYTPILEMAQLKQKLPREALAAIGGLQCPELSWKRLEEVYGNREISIMSAHQEPPRLQIFKVSAPRAAHRIGHGSPKVYDRAAQHRRGGRPVGRPRKPSLHHPGHAAGIQG